MDDEVFPGFKRLNLTSRRRVIEMVVERVYQCGQAFDAEEYHQQLRDYLTTTPYQHCLSKQRLTFKQNQKVRARLENGEDRARVLRELEVFTAGQVLNQAALIVASEQPPSGDMVRGLLAILSFFVSDEQTLGAYSAIHRQVGLSVQAQVGTRVDGQFQAHSDATQEGDVMLLTADIHLRLATCLDARDVRGREEADVPTASRVGSEAAEFREELYEALRGGSEMTTDLLRLVTGSQSSHGVVTPGLLQRFIDSVSAQMATTDSWRITQAQVDSAMGVLRQFSGDRGAVLDQTSATGSINQVRASQLGESDLRTQIVSSLAQEYEQVTFTSPNGEETMVKGPYERVHHHNFVKIEGDPSSEYFYWHDKDEERLVTENIRKLTGWAYLDGETLEVASEGADWAARVLMWKVNEFTETHPFPLAGKFACSLRPNTVHGDEDYAKAMEFYLKRVARELVEDPGGIYKGQDPVGLALRLPGDQLMAAANTRRSDVWAHLEVERVPDDDRLAQLSKRALESENPEDAEDLPEGGLTMRKLRQVERWVRNELATCCFTWGMKMALLYRMWSGFKWITKVAPDLLLTFMLDDPEVFTASSRDDVKRNICLLYTSDAADE